MIGIFRPYKFAPAAKRWHYVIGAIAAFVLIGVTAPSSGDTRTAVAASQTSPVVDKTPRPAEAAAATPPAETQESRLTGSQTNAARSAQQYLTISGFSRKGLISQLSSDAGDRYDVSDATIAVDSLDVDWNQQAVRSAKQYLTLSGFSCSGLVEQLSSGAGDQYTKSQATYGAKQAGAC